MFLRPAPMHIPDGFLSTLVAIVFWVISVLVVAHALRRTGQDLGERQIPLMGVLAAAHLRRADAQLHRHRRYLRAPAWRGHCHHPARTLGGGDRPDHRRQRPGADLPGWRVAGPGRQLVQHGHRRRGGVLLRLYQRAPVNRCSVMEPVRQRLRFGVVVNLHRFALCRPAAGVVRNVSSQYRRSSDGRHPCTDRRRRRADHRRGPGLPICHAARSHQRRTRCGQGRRWHLGVWPRDCFVPRRAVPSGLHSP